MGIPLRKGMITNIVDNNGQLYSKAIQKIKGIEAVDTVVAGNRHVYALTRAGSTYFWG